MTGYQKLKDRVKEESTETLVVAFTILEEIEDMGTEELVTYTALTSELEDRGVIEFNEDTWKYEFKAE